MNKDKALSILGLDAKATPSDIKSAYRRLARANHPDKMGSAELFKLVQEAYETLEATIKADANRRAEAERAEVERRESRRKAAERIAELQRKIAEASEAKRKAEVKYSAAIKRYGLTESSGLIDKALETLHAAVETEAQLRVELVHKNAVLKEIKWMDNAEQPGIAAEVITAEWESMPEFKRKNDWDYSQYVIATNAIFGEPYNDNDRRIVTGNISGMFDAEITDLIEGRIGLTGQDFRAGGFFIWGEYLTLSGHHKLAINHYNSALRIKSNVWQIYDSRGRANAKLGYYAEAINDFAAGIECAKHNRSAMRQLQYGIKRAREKANSPPP